MTIENNIIEKPKNRILESIKKYRPKVLVVAGAVTGTTSLVIVGLAAMEYANLMKESIRNGKAQKNKN